MAWSFSLCLGFIVGLYCVSFADGQALNQHRGPWTLVFKIPAGQRPAGHSGVVKFWEASGSMNEGDASAMMDFRTSSKIYKSAKIDNWGKTMSVSAVRLAAYKNNKEVAYVIFDAFGKDKNSWMDCNNILDSSWTDLKSTGKNYCHFDNTGGAKRNFFINKSYGGCDHDYGWFILKDYDATSGCSNWDPVSSSAPYIKYSSSTTYLNWKSGSTADSFAIFVLDWQMVFKGVQGVVPQAGSLRALWEGSTTENSQDDSVRTLTKAPSKTFKSGVIDNWTDLFIDIAKYAYFVNGKEVAWIVFNARNTDKNSWLHDNNVLYTRYTDLIGTHKVGASIAGDGTRRFAFHKEHGGCPNDKAWMIVLDEPNGGQPCSWDKNVRARPYFLYASGTTWSLCQTHNRWNSATFPVAEVLGLFIKGWVPLFKVAHRQSVSPASGVYNLWTGTYTVNEHDSDAMSYKAGSKTYKSAIVDNWSKHYISAVRVSYYAGGKEKAYVVFDAHGADKNSWYDCSRILYTSYSDLNRKAQNNFCSVLGDSGHKRFFYLNKHYGGCNADTGWFSVVEGTACSWEQKTTKPYFLYSDAGSSELSNNMAVAEVFAISATMDLCNPNPCKNSGSCVDRAVRYECTCTGTWTGMACTDRHGSWSDWGNWGTCTRSCAGGTKTRTRSCTGRIGSGNACSGSTSTSTSCNTHSCAVNGAWGGWGGWGSCSKSCGSGTKTRTRGCDSPAPQHGGSQCPGSGSDSAGCNTQTCPSWIPIFKVAHRQSVAPASGVHNLWTGTYTVNPYDETAMSYKAGTKTFKSSAVDNWSRHNIERVRVSFYSGEQEKFHVVFNAAGTDKNNWFACNRILYTSYNDLNTGSTNNFCSINGDSGHNRRFYLNKEYGGCNGDVGWMAVVEGTACGWEQKTTRPYFLYSDASGSELSNNMAVAEVFVISVNMDICNPNPCQNGAQCSDSGARYQCSCSGSWKGMACQDRDGVWGSWGSWASCSTTCGGGSKIKRRSCTGKAGAGSDCPGSSSTSTSCNTHNCPIHGQWGAWAAWGSCSKTCAGGTKNRKRACNNPAPQYNGNDCAGSSSSSTSCNTHHCPIHGAWSNWAAWGSCTVTCGGGTQDRGRTCSNPTPQYGGQDCAGAKSSRQDCNTHHCPIDGGWTSWNSWTSCSLTCKDYGTSQTGTKSRQRSCTNPEPQYQGKDCPNFDFELAVCTTSTYCAIHGGFTQWTAWTACSVTCATGSKTRERTCTDPSPRFGGNNCAGALDDTATCTLSPCPIDGKWTAWTSWSTCTKTCGTGESHRTRTCTNPAPQYNGAACGGAPSEQKLCNTQVCIIDGDWGSWTPWGGCTASCGNGTQSKTRVCDSPRPKNGGLPCPGSSSEFQNCNPTACPAPLAGVYTQKCPSGWFSCESGAMTCIQQAFVCDCGRDCDDGSDEDTSYANCSPELVETCGSGAEGVKMPMMSLLLCVAMTLYLFL